MKFFVLMLITIFNLSFCKDKKNGFLSPQYKPISYSPIKVVVKKTNQNILKEKLPTQNAIYAYISTTQGDMILELYDEKAPKTVQNFIDLAQGKKTGKPFYDGLVFHRVINNFMIQGGCPIGDGTGGPGYKFEDEINGKSLGLDKIKAKQVNYYNQQIQQTLISYFNIQTEAQFNKKKPEIEKLYQKMQEFSALEILYRVGYRYNEVLQSAKMEKYTLAMANAGPNTNGSQFFINQVDNPHLNGLHTVFGKLVKGYEILDRIVQKGNSATTIEKVMIIDKR